MDDFILNAMIRMSSAALTEALCRLPREKKIEILAALGKLVIEPSKKDAK